MKKLISLLTLLTLSLVGCSSNSNSSAIDSTTSQSSTKSTYWESDDYDELAFDTFDEMIEKDNLVYLYDFQTLREYAKVTLLANGIENVTLLNPEEIYSSIDNSFNVAYDEEYKNTIILESYELYDEKLGFFDTDIGEGGTMYSLAVECMLYQNIKFTDYEIQSKQISSNEYFWTLVSDSQILGYMRLMQMNDEKVEFMKDYVKRNLIQMTNDK